MDQDPLCAFKHVAETDGIQAKTNELVFQQGDDVYNLKELTGYMNDVGERHRLTDEVTIARRAFKAKYADTRALLSSQIHGHGYGQAHFVTKDTVEALLPIFKNAEKKALVAQAWGVSMSPNFPSQSNYINFPNKDGALVAIQVDSTQVVPIVDTIQKIYGYEAYKSAKKAWETMRRFYPALASKSKIFRFNGSGSNKFGVHVQDLPFVIETINEHRKRHGYYISDVHTSVQTLLADGQTSFKVPCAGCGEEWILQPVGVGQVEVTWGRYRVDVAFIDNKTDQITSIIEVLATSKVSQRKSNDLDKSRIPWCEVDILEAHRANEIGSQKIVASRGSMCKSCLTKKKKQCMPKCTGDRQTNRRPSHDNLSQMKALVASVKRMQNQIDILTAQVTALGATPVHKRMQHPTHDKDADKKRISLSNQGQQTLHCYFEKKTAHV